MKDIDMEWLTEKYIISLFSWEVTEQDNIVWSVFVKRKQLHKNFIFTNVFLKIMKMW